jgi:hypothetical protein
MKYRPGRACLQARRCPDFATSMAPAMYIQPSGATGNNRRRPLSGEGATLITKVS